MARNVRPLQLKESDKKQLQQWVSAFGTPQQIAVRCRIVLDAAEGVSVDEMATRWETNRKTVMLWRKRFETEGLESLWEVATGRGRKPTYGPEKIQSIIDATLQSKPKGMTHWSCRLMAEAQKISKSTISNIWRSHNLKPHRTKTFKLSRDAKFLEKLTDVVGLYLNPPQQAVLLCVDEKSQIQALDRTQPGLPIKKGRCGTMTHDYKRNGTTNPVRGSGGPQWPCCRSVPRAPSPSRVPAISETPGPRVSGEDSPSSRYGQLRDPQTCQRPKLAEAASPLCLSLCTHQFQLAQSGGAMVR